MGKKITTLEQYNKKYRNRRYTLLRCKKSEVVDFDVFAKKCAIDTKNNLLKGRKWILIGDTYYEIPKAPRFVWFRNLNAGIQAAVSIFSVGIVASAITVPTVMLNNKGGTPVKPEPVPPKPEKKNILNIWQNDTSLETLLKDEGLIEKDEENYSLTYRDDTQIVFTTIDGPEGVYKPLLTNGILSYTDPKDIIDMYVCEQGLTNSFSDFLNDSLSLDLKKLEIENLDEILKLGFEESNKQGMLEGKIQKSIAFDVSPVVTVYRRSYAKEVLGTDDPAEVSKLIGSETKIWDEFIQSSEKFKAAGMYTLAGVDEMLQLQYVNADTPLIVNEKLHIDPKIEFCLDMRKKLYDDALDANKHENTDDWKKGINDSLDKPVFAYFGDIQFIDKILPENCGKTSGDWAVCTAPINALKGGHDIFVNPKTDNADLVKELYQKIFDTSNLEKSSFKILNNIKVMESRAKMSKYENPILGGQNPFEFYLQALSKASTILSRNNSLNYTLFNDFTQFVEKYALGELSRELAISNYKQQVLDYYGIESE